MTSSASTPWTKDVFLGAILGKTVYRLADPEHAKKAIDSISGEESWMIETKVPVGAVDAVAGLNDLGFRLIDTNVQLNVCVSTITLGTPAPTISVREARGEDRSAIERIAADNLVTSRFHLDQQIGSELGRRVKTAWAGNYFEGRRGEGLLVTERDGAIGGFLLILQHGSSGVIDLVALDPGLRGLGAVGAMMGVWLSKAPAIDRVVVGTQISNVRSLRAYGKLGFRACGAAYVLHCHGPSPNA